MHHLRTLRRGLPAAAVVLALGLTFAPSATAHSSISGHSGHSKPPAHHEKKKPPAHPDKGKKDSKPQAIFFASDGLRQDLVRLLKLQ